MKRHLKKIYKKIDYTEYGGAQLLGVNGVCVIGHGRSNPAAVRNAIDLAREFVAKPGPGEDPGGDPPLRARLEGSRRRAAFEGRVSIVTGASQGIGEAIARDLAAEGAAVVLVDVQAEKLEAVAASIAAAGGRADGPDGRRRRHGRRRGRPWPAVVAAHGRIDHLVNNAGITRDSLLHAHEGRGLGRWSCGVNLKGDLQLAPRPSCGR
ncbi:MAG: SDR family NAD(P)-dependent oxidoreductase [Desulfomicrobium escambiense]|nr:SDR family NAD(P)-dependent oxidoreductase [Desulfomicrobium escambiense]